MTMTGRCVNFPSRLRCTVLRFTVLGSCMLGFLTLGSPVWCPNSALAGDVAAGVEFDRDVRPILSDRCFVCHGPDAERREADLRLDIPDGAFAALDDSLSVIRPGNLEQSAVYQRISATDEDMRMPPADSKLSLSDHEKEIIQHWIEQGAIWKQHWAFRPIQPPDIPPVQDEAWPRNPIDRFVLARLEGIGFEADVARLAASG